MIQQYVTYTSEQINNDNAQNILVELTARCLVAGDRIIIEQGEKNGDKYIMVDFDPSDHSNPECELDGNEVCMVSSVDNNDPQGGKYFECFTNYFDAINYVAKILREDGFREMYIETY